MSQRILDIAAILAIAMYLDLNHLHLAFPRDELINAMGTLSILLLTFPVTSIAARIVDGLNRRSVENPVTLKVCRNRIDAVDALGRSATMGGMFTDGHVLIGDRHLFEEAAWKAIRDMWYSDKKLQLAPYVIVTGERPLTPVEQEAAKRALLSAGALHVQIADETYDPLHPVAFAQKFPPNNFV